MTTGECFQQKTTAAPLRFATIIYLYRFLYIFVLSRKAASSSMAFTCF